ncbi:unnamed protein product [Adineta steineri]|uniref:ADP ribosyltransferase domain-containing protein n=1 Tax=Adineta steineri TaxID=433720 RepID=A0A818QY73_9BILA|nr:unnamed protein product [Adineta steineri]
MGSGQSTTNASTVPESAEGRRRINIQQVQNVLLIWLDNNIDETNDDCQNTMTKLRSAVYDIKTYTNGDQCLEFIRTIIDKKVCMIISGSLGQHIVPHVHNMSQVDSIFIFCGNRKHHEQWVKDWSKIKGVFTDIIPICEALKKAAHQCEQNAIPMSFVGLNKKLNQLDSSFMYTQIIKEIILTIQFKQNHIQDYLDYCRDAFVDNKEETKNIEKLKLEYRRKTPIYWYTCQMFLYPMLNRALRSMDSDIIIRMGFFIGDLHRQIQQLHKKQYAGTTAANTFTVYRGQGLSTKDFEQMKETKGGLLSFNNFLSTSAVRKVSLDFAQAAAINSGQVGVLFIMKINPAQSTTPFASIAGISDFQDEEEVLFSMHSVFRVQDIKQMDENNPLYEVNLTLTADNDPELNRLTNYIRQECFPNEEGWYRLGLLLFKMGRYDTAEGVYQILLDQKKDDKDRAIIYHRFGQVKGSQKKYQEALNLYEISLTIKNKILPPNDPDLASCYNNIGAVHNNMANYPAALASFEKAAEIGQKSLFLNFYNLDLAMFFNNIGNVHTNMCNYPEALSSYEKALEIGRRSLLPCPYSLASSYDNIGAMYRKMGDYPKALSSYEKALEILHQSLPPNHPQFAYSSSYIGSVYYSMENYEKAISYYEKALEIWQQSLPSDHPSLAESYNAIGLAYKNMGNYSKAHTYYERAIQIAQKSLPLEHPDLQKYRNNLEDVKSK